MQVRDGAMIEMVHGLRHACIHACREGWMKMWMRDEGDGCWVRVVVVVVDC